MEPVESFDEQNFYTLCELLAAKDDDLKQILTQYGYPPFWSRPPTFETLVHIILEQQVSLASALAALNKLKDTIEIISPQSILLLPDETLKSCYFSRQKITYIKHLSTEIIEGNLNLSALKEMQDEEVLHQLIKIKGIGNWSATVYLMMVLHRPNHFPFGDVALLTSVRETKKLPKECTKLSIEAIANKWRPYRTIAAFILWHGYLSKRNR